MAQLVTIKMSKFDNQPWGFRLQGGIDFAAPLTVQKVHGGGLAEKAGLQVGDALLRVNGADIFQLRHKDAQDAITRAGNNFELVVSRGGGLPKTAGPIKQPDPLPQPAPAPMPATPIAQLDKTKLSKTGSMLNFTAKPFVRLSESKEPLSPTPAPPLENNNYLVTAPTTNDTPFTPEEKSRAKEVLTARLAQMRVQPPPGFVRSTPPTSLSSASSPSSSALSSPSLTRRTGPNAPRSDGDGGLFVHTGRQPFMAIQKPDGGNLKLVNRQFNSPMELYSEENIAETLSSQAEVLAQGVLGVNFKKNERHYDPGNSEVFKMLQEMERAPREPEPGIDIDPADASPAQKGLGAAARGDSTSFVIQSRAFQRIQQLTNDSSSSSSPTQPNVLVKNVEKASTPVTPITPERAVHFGMLPAATPLKVKIPSFPAQNVGSTPPAGGVRIFPAGPAPSFHHPQPASPVTPAKPFSPVHQQVKVHEEVMQQSSEHHHHQSHIVMESSVTSSVMTTAVTEETVRVEELVASSLEASHVADQHPEAPVAAAPSAVKPVSFAPTQPAAHRPLDDIAAQVQQPPEEAKVEPPALPPLPVVAEEKVPEEPQLPPIAAAPAPVAVSAPVAVEPTPPPAASVSVEPLAVLPPLGLAMTPAGRISQNININTNPPPHPPPDAGSAPAGGFGGFGGAPSASPPKGTGSGTQSAPRRGRGVLNNAAVGPGSRIPVCASCSAQIRGKFVTALGLTWCPNHFLCAMPQCRRELHECGFVEEQKKLYCEGCFETHLAPTCARCSKRVKGECLNAIGKQFHPECFACTYCGRLFGNSHFYLEDGLPYCETDWNELFTTKCFGCGFPIEAGDRWVEAMNNNYHSQCFICSVCKKNLEGQSFLGKGGRPMCKSHAR